MTLYRAISIYLQGMLSYTIIISTSDSDLATLKYSQSTLAYRSILSLVHACERYPAGEVHTWHYLMWWLHWSNDRLSPDVPKLLFMGPAGPMLCSSQASGSPFWNELTFQVTWLQMTRHPLHLYVGVVA